MAIHVVLNQKGGVGKSTIAVNLAAVTADVLNHDDDPDSSSSVAALSVDPQGSAVWWASRIDDLPFHIAQAHDDLDGLKQLQQPARHPARVRRHPWLDRPQRRRRRFGDPLGRGPAADALRTVLDVADQVIVPIETEPLSFDPTARTINKVLAPAQDSLHRRHQQLGSPRRQATISTRPRNSSRPTSGRSRTPSSGTTSCTPGPAPTAMVVTEYPLNRVALQAREDFYKFALELNVGGGR